MSKMWQTLQTIVYSYNRPAQLYLLLESMERFTDFENVTVIYRREEEKYLLSYRAVKVRFPKVKFIHQVDPNLKEYTMKELNQPYTMFCLDDNVFLGKVSLKDEQYKQFTTNPEILSFSLRLGENCNYCFDRDIPVEVPRMIDGMWEWFKYSLDWGYPMSLSCTIFRTDEIKEVLDKIEFTTPSQMEAQMCKTPIQKPLMLCYPTQKVLEMPINVVQTEFLNNRTGDVDIEWLNKEFLKDKKIDLDHIVKQEFNSPQQLADIKWRKR